MKSRLRSPDLRIFGLILGLCLCLSVEASVRREIQGATYLNLSEVARRLGMDHAEREPGRIVRLSSHWTTLDFELHQRHFLLNGRRVTLGSPIAVSRGKLYISERDYAKTLQPILTPQIFGVSLPKVRHIVLDPGHGGNDPGATNPELGLIEKNLTLALARSLQSKLEGMGYRVTLTRTRDEYLGLAQRAEFANRLDADLFISLHVNAVSNGAGVSGIETFALTPEGQPSTSSTSLTASDRKTWPGNAQDPWNTLAAYHIQDALVAGTGGRDRGLRRARFAVLRGLNCPGVLVEAGFVTHPVEGRNLGSAAYRERLAEAIATGVLNYQKRLNQVAVGR